MATLDATAVQQKLKVKGQARIPTGSTVKTAFTGLSFSLSEAENFLPPFPQ